MSEPTFNGCVHLWLSSWMGWDQSKRQEDCPACPYCEIERLARELEEERELHLTARGQSDAYEMGMESWKGGYERLTRELEMQQLVENRLRLSWDESDKEAKRLRAAISEALSAFNSVDTNSAITILHRALLQEPK